MILIKLRHDVLTGFSWKAVSMERVKEVKRWWLPAIIGTLVIIPVLEANAANRDYQKVELYELASQVAQSSGNIVSKIQSLREQARKYAASEQKDKALQTLNQAFALAKPTDSGSLVDWVDDYAVIGQYEKALEIANTLEEGSYKASARIAIARAYFKAGRYNQALELAKLIPDGFLRAVPEDEDPKQVFLKALALKYTQAGLYNRALQVTSASEDVPAQIEVLQIIAREYAKVDQKEKASEILAKALERANTITKIDRLTERSGGHVCTSNAGILTDLASDWAKLGQRQQAFEVLATALEKAKTENQIAAGCTSGDEDGALSQLRLLSKVVDGYAQLGEKDKATEAVAIAKATVQTQPNSYKLSILSQILTSYGPTGQQEQAAASLEQAVSLANAIPNQFQRILALADIASAYATIGQKDKATELLSTIVQLAKTYVPRPNSGEELNINSRLASAYVRVGQPELALQLTREGALVGLSQLVQESLETGQISQAEQIAQTIKNDFDRNTALQPIALAYVKAGQLAQAQAAISTVGDKYRNPQVLAAIALAHAKMGQSSQALSVLAKVPSLKVLQTAKKTLALGLGDLAIAHSASGDKKKAAQLLSQAIEAAKTSEPEGGVQILEENYDQHPLDLMLSFINSALAAKQDELAFQVVRTIEDSRFRVTALRQIAHQYELAGEKAKASQALSQALQVASTIADADAKAQLLAGIAQQQIN